MSEMVERVRKAIEAHCYEVGFKLKPDAGNRLARAAIEAMREPTDGMVDAGYHRAKPYLGTETMAQAYRANKTGRKYPFPSMEVGDYFKFPAMYRGLVQVAMHCNMRKIEARFCLGVSPDGEQICKRVL